MKKMFKKITTLLLAGALCIGMASTAFAADTTIEYEGKNSWYFQDFTKEYTETDLFNNFKNVMPGDELEQKVTVTNKSGKSVKLFMRAEVGDLTYDRDLAADEGKGNETVATMTDFLSQLSMKVYDGDELIYGDTDAEGNWVSPDQLDGLKENKLLGEIAANRSVELTVHLQVPLTLDNTYANRVGEVDWVFSIEETGGGGNNPGGGGDDTVSRTVYKVWQDSDDSKRPESITVILLGTDKETGRVVEEKTAELNAENQWTCSWTGLDSAYQWDIKELNIPDGYEAGYKYSATGHVVTITNSDGNDTPDPDSPGGDSPDSPVFTSDLTVVKNWDDDNNPNRPDSVTLQLYNGSTEVETITLTEADGWTYTWDDLAAEGEWRVIEVDIPDGYTPVYSMVDGVVTITNTESLIDAGQMNWPVPVLGGLGVLVLACGVVLMRKKKDHAAE